MDGQSLLELRNLIITTRKELDDLRAALADEIAYRQSHDIAKDTRLWKLEKAYNADAVNFERRLRMLEDAL